MDDTLKRILIVDDDPRIVDRLATLLAPKYEAILASTGFEALAAMDDHAIDVVLLDLRMPGLDGAGFVAELKARRLSVPVILMSANPDLAQRARALGIRHYLPKPFPVARLEEMLSTLA